MAKHHLTIGRDKPEPWCNWLGCDAGRSIGAQSGVECCDYSSRAAAEAAAKKLRPHFKRGAVRVIPYPCPNAKEA